MQDRPRELEPYTTYPLYMWHQLNPGKIFEAWKAGCKGSYRDSPKWKDATQRGRLKLITYKAELETWQTENLELERLHQEAQPRTEHEMNQRLLDLYRNRTGNKTIQFAEMEAEMRVVVDKFAHRTHITSE